MLTSTPLALSDDASIDCDIDQIDTPYLDSLSNGLTIVAEKFKNEKLAGHITLKKGERSSLATIASKII